jgi:hypothetical protein
VNKGLAMRYDTRALAGTAVFLLISACTAGAPATATPSSPGSQNPSPIQSPTPSAAGAGEGTPAPNAAFSGSLQTVPGVSGDISFVISDNGQIAEMRLDGGLTNFDCGGGRTIIDSGTTTFFFPDPIVIEGGSFSISRGAPLPLDWDGVFDSATSAHGSIRLSGGTDCSIRPPSVTWSATAN